MTYVKRRGMILMVEDSQVQKYVREGFKIYTPPTTPEQEQAAEGKESSAVAKAGAKDGSNGK